jgi:hypothetical protein
MTKDPLDYKHEDNRFRGLRFIAPAVMCLGLIAALVYWLVWPAWTHG